MLAINSWIRCRSSFATSLPFSDNVEDKHKHGHGSFGCDGFEITGLVANQHVPVDGLQQTLVFVTHIVIDECNFGGEIQYCELAVLLLAVSTVTC